MARLTLEALVSSVNELPVFPDAILKIMDMLESSQSDAKSIEKEMIKDQGLTLHILKMANSAYYGSRREITSVSSAVVRLGFSAVKSMVMALAVGDMLNQPLEGYALRKEALWRQSQLCAITSRLIAKKIGYDKVDQAYTAGLLKDIGKVVLNEHMKEEMTAIFEAVEKDHRSFIEVEEEILGFNHAQVGEKVALKWKLPLVLIEAIAYHHQPNQAVEDQRLTDIIHLADGMMMTLGFEIGIDGLDYVISSESLERLGLDEAELENLMSEIVDYVNKENTFL